LRRLLAWLDHARDEASCARSIRGLVLCEADADALLDAMAALHPPPEPTGSNALTFD